jgi:nucleolar MIF4G domain-containing protein 1
MQGICGQIDQLYLHHSRADMNESLTQILVASCITPVLMPERLGLEMAMMVAVLHSNVGTEVGKNSLVEPWDTRPLGLIN